jgi:hypothetical protein
MQRIPGQHGFDTSYINLLTGADTFEKEAPAFMEHSTDLAVLRMFGVLLTI